MHLSSFPSLRRACRLGFGLAAFVLPLTFSASALRAQMPKVFVSLHGSDGNPGTSVSPKRTFQAANDAVAAGGEIVVLDTAGYGGLIVSKALTVTVPTGVNGFVTVGGNSSGITLNAGSDANVTLRGLTIEGDGTSGTNAGISVTSVGQLTVEGCTIRGFGTGISLPTPSTKSAIIRHSVIRDVSTGVFNVTSGNGNASTVTLEGVTLNHCGSGVYTSATSGAAVTTMNRCIVHGSGLTGIKAGVGGVNFVSGCTVSGCGTTGVYADGTNGQTVGGVNYTRGDNLFTNNADNGSFNGTVFAQ